MDLSRNHLKRISKSIYHHFHGLDNPPAREIHVPVDAIRSESKDTFSATVRFVVEYCGRKVNQIRIKFKLDESGNFDPNSWKYV